MTDERRGPQRIVCLTEETTETIYRLGEQHRIVGISGFTQRPKEARKEKPKISTFRNAKVDSILELKPDMVLGFSHIQADIAAELVRAGLDVHIFNYRSVAGIFEMIRFLGALLDCADKADILERELHQGLDAIRAAAEKLPRRPRVYFEEWNDPLISCVGWVSELIELAGGDHCFRELASGRNAKQRRIEDPAMVIERAPELILASWCGKRFKPEDLYSRPGWKAIPAVANGQVYEINSSDILQPGPAALTDGVARIHDLIRRCV
ncbi:iron complex transport system substrate-binding protein [Methylohalomonas lacus]|uniref:Iron complex transport system substrate-binding protein n=1 Tax=Methylohalomonas lacus TaxID=398773 RepID=A0AAE3HIY1_9GAMM|nr:cobalamin-binding protein [Methylohalomonas lacus]MCS3902690.1 iron complex transport system substrate-binding protein [Methylohalomonas lacus]